MARPITEAEKSLAKDLLGRAKTALKAIENFDQEKVDRLCRAVAWAVANESTAVRLTNMSVDESGMGDREPTRRFKVLGILRDALRQKSMGLIEEIPEKGISKYAKPAGVIAALSLLPYPRRSLRRGSSARLWTLEMSSSVAVGVEFPSSRRRVCSPAWRGSLIRISQRASSQEGSRLI